MKAIQDYFTALRFWLITYNSWPMRHIKGLIKGLLMGVGLVFGPLLVGCMLFYPGAVQKQLTAKKNREKYQ